MIDIVRRTSYPRNVNAVVRRTIRRIHRTITIKISGIVSYIVVSVCVYVYTIILYLNKCIKTASHQNDTNNMQFLLGYFAFLIDNSEH